MQSTTNPKGFGTSQLGVQKGFNIASFSSCCGSCRCSRQQNQGALNGFSISLRSLESADTRHRLAYRSGVQKILHDDLDTYYAQIEQRDNPGLRGKPVAVGKNGARGVLTTASYEARRFGVGSALPVATAKRLCPQLIVVPIRMEVYRCESQKIHEVFARYADLTEPLSLDEAYLDVTEPKQGPPSGTLLAGRIRADIRDAVGLTASVGISYCKFLAKLGPGMNKPDGQTVITPEHAQQLIPTLPVAAFFGVGPKTAARLNELGIHTGQDLREQTREFLVDRFGKHGGYLFDIARGIDERPVNPDRLRKSIGAETTFEQDVISQGALIAELVLACNLGQSKYNLSRQGS